MKSCLMMAILVIACSSNAFSQPDSLWSRKYGGRSIDVCNSILQLSDGGYFLAGNAAFIGAGSTDFWLVRTNANGDSLWSQTYGGVGDDRCSMIRQTSEGAFILVGYTRSYGAGDEDFYAVLVDSQGNSIWSRTYGGSEYDQCEAVLPTADRGYILAGTSYSFGVQYSDMWIVKIDAHGDSLWSRTYGGEGRDGCHAVVETDDGGYFLTGYTDSFAEEGGHVWLIKLDAEGDSLWSRHYATSTAGIGTSCEKTSDGGCIIAGYTQPSQNMDYYVLKTDSSGNLLWNRTYGGETTDVCHDVEQTPDGGYILFGSSCSFGEEFDTWLVRINAEGDSLWSQTYGGTDGDACYTGLRTVDGGYAIAGSTTSFNAARIDFWLVKTGPDPVTDVSNYTTAFPAEISLSAYPNPFNSELTLDIAGFTRDARITLHNLLGQEVDVIHSGLVTGSGIHYLAPASLSSGLYFVRAADARNVKSMKVVFLK